MSAKQLHPRIKSFRIRSADREYFIINLSMLLKAAVPIGAALSSLKETSRSRQLKSALIQIENAISNGTPFWQALDQSGVVSAKTATLVHLGEQAGNLAENMHIAAKQEEKQRIFRAKLRSAMIYPSFVLGMTATIGLGVAWFLLPRLAETFAELDVQLPLISRIMIGFGLFLKQSGFWAIPLLITGLIFISYLLFGAPKTRHIGQRLLLHLPGVSRLIREVEIARFGYLLGTLLNAGLSITQAMALLKQATIVPEYRNLYIHLARTLEEGYSLRKSLVQYKSAAKLLPPAIQQMIIAGERSGSLPESLINIGNMYEERADISNQNLAAILEPILLIIVWLGVMIVIIAVILPIYSLVGS